MNAIDNDGNYGYKRLLSHCFKCGSSSSSQILDVFRSLIARTLEKMQSSNSIDQSGPFFVDFNEYTLHTYIKNTSQWHVLVKQNLQLLDHYYHLLGHFIHIYYFFHRCVKCMYTHDYYYFFLRKIELRAKRMFLDRHERTPVCNTQT